MLRFGLLRVAGGLALIMAAQHTSMSQPPASSRATLLPDHDTRAVIPPRTLDTPRVFPHFASRQEWEAYQKRLRDHVLVSCGLYPLPPKTPLRAKVFGRVERDGYTIEKVYFQTYPGFYLAGNLYRPLHKKTVDSSQRPVKDAVNAELSPPEHPKTRTPEHLAHPELSSLHPAVLIAHGHWEEGRMADGPNGSIPARAITFARQGYVAFTYDMVGCNDTRQIPQHRTFAADNKHWLWGVSLMGLQTWNSVRALDFLVSLPDVDKSRLAITGESGGGTQTMLLGAIDDRLAAVGPCVMVSHSMQGGCLCENAPGLRIDASNMEIAAMPAPRPQVMVGATGDWTKTMMTVEGPGVESVYKLYDKTDQLHYAIFPFNHNINKTSREAVYQFFGRTLLHDPNGGDFAEPPYKMDPVADLRVFPDNMPLPPDAKTADQLSDYLIALGQEQLEKRKPRDQRSLTAFKTMFAPLWEQTLALELPTKPQLTEMGIHTYVGNKESIATGILLGRTGRSDSIPLIYLTPDNAKIGRATVLIHPQGKAAFFEKTAEGEVPGPLVRSLLAKGEAVVLMEAFLTGTGANAQASEARSRSLQNFGEFFTTYNRTDLQERVQDIVTVCRYLHQKRNIKLVSLIGQEQAGLWALLTAPAADRVAADCAQTDLTTDDALLTSDLYAPCLRRMGDFRTAATLAAPHPLLLHNTGSRFNAMDWIKDVYGGIGQDAKLRTAPARLEDNALVEWITQ